MDRHLLRGQQLYHLGRHALAEVEFRKAVLADPENSAVARAFLAFVLLPQGKPDEAAREAGLAVAAGPGMEVAHYALAAVAKDRGRTADAEAAARECLRLNPEFNPALTLLAGIALQRGDAAGALAFAEQGLRADATDEDCATLRTAALLKLGRIREATANATDTLRQDPESSPAHAGRGWAALHAGDAPAALLHFKEALRLDATSEFARAGLIEALKARYRVYRVGLRGLLWFGRRGRAERVGIVVVALLAQQGIGEFARTYPGLAWLAWPAFGAITVAFLLVQINDPLSNLFLRLNRYGRQALSADERRGSTAVGLALLGAVVGLLVGIFGEDGWDYFGIVAAIGCVFLSLPLTSLFKLRAGRGRKLLAVYTAVMGLVLVAVLWQIDEAFDAATVRAARTHFEAAREYFNLLAVLTFLSGFLAARLNRLR